MKISIMILLLLAPIIGSAQDFQGMSEKDMQKMMQQMQQMESCMQQVDQKKLQALEKRAQQIEAELKSLCASGKRDAAQAKAISFEKEMENDSAMQTVKKCGEIMKDGQNGLLYRPGDITGLRKNIHQLLSDHKIYIKLAKSGFETSKRYTWTKRARKILDLLQ